MQIHLYTSLCYIELLKAGKEIYAWNKSEATKSDIHISLDINEYNISHDISMENGYIVSKKDGM